MACIAFTPSSRWRRRRSQHDGLQRNAILAAFGALKDLDLVIVVDEDIDIRDPQDVEYALATRMEASRDLILVPEARGHEYVRAGNNGIRTKLGIDASVPFDGEGAVSPRGVLPPRSAEAFRSCRIVPQRRRCLGPPSRCWSRPHVDNAAQAHAILVRAIQASHEAPVGAFHRIGEFIVDR